MVGRGPELQVIRELLGAAAADGGALFLSGETGIGKSALLDAAAELAAGAGTRVLRAAGTEFEADIAFAGLHQALWPLQDELAELSEVHRGALSVALGLADGPPADRLVVSTAALTMLRHAARNTPLLLVVDDLHWLDRSSAVMLGFVARRLTGSRVALVAAGRAQADSYVDRAGVPGFELRPLDDDAAAALVSDRFPGLSPPVRRRLLAEARGNPLALLELPNALHGSAAYGLPGPLPLTHRLTTIFGSRVAQLPAPTRRFLLLAALDGTGELGILDAAAGNDGLADLLPADHAGLVVVDEGCTRVAFRHPLIRSTVVELSTDGERRAGHRALAAAATDQPERQVWHLAEASAGPDERVAALLVETGRRRLTRGDGVAAVAALVRAAQLSPRGADRSRRLAEAAYVGADVTGDLRAVSQLLTDARRADPELGGSLRAAVAAAYLLINGEGDVDTAHRLLVAAIQEKAGGYDADDHALTEALHALLMVCFFCGGRAELWEPLHAAVARLKPRPPAVLSLCDRAFADPARTTGADLAELDATVGHLHDDADPTRIVWVGRAALFVDRMAGCREAHWRVVRDGRDGGAVASSIGALINLCLDDLLTGRWEEAAQLADEGIELCESHGYRLLRWPLWFGRAVLAASRGDGEAARALADRMARWAAPRRAGAVQLYAHHVRALDALGRGDAGSAYRHAAAVSAPGTLAAHVPLALWTAPDLVEAAVRAGRAEEAAAHAAAMNAAGLAALSPRLALVTAGATALSAPAADASPLFEAALAVPGAERWPFDLARVRLAYGERLRRLRAPSEARDHLAGALDAFQRLGAAPWVARTRTELRAAGLVTADRDDGRAALTPQEREIALLAATGLTNKQIGQRLHLSHRTVGAHLYRVFPKLGITSRAALRDALR